MSTLYSPVRVMRFSLPSAGGYFVWLLAWLLGLRPAHAQQPGKTVSPHQQAWFAYINQTRLSTRWGVWTDLNLRRTDFLDRWNQNMIRLGATYYLADNFRLTAGYVYAETYPARNQLIRPEHRPWQQIWWTRRYGRINTTQWVRAEQRFLRRMQGDRLAEGYSFNWRFRYNLLAQLPLWGEPVVRPGVLNAVVQNEVFINAGRQITHNTFDQNRFFVGVSYPVNRSWLVQAGYMNQFIQTAAGNAYESNHTARLFVFHNLDLRQKP